MKKRAIIFLICLTMVAGMFVWMPPMTAQAATTDQQHIVDWANYLYNTTWVCQKTVSGWCGSSTFVAGNTYHLPYGQPINSGYYIGFGVSVDTFLESTKDANSVFYNSRSSYGTTYSTYYATDCSAFVSSCWGISRHTTYGIPNVSKQIGAATASNAYQLQLGDALNSNSVGHVVLVTGLDWSSGDLVIEITEQTPPQLKRSYYTPTQLGNKYSSDYTIYRYEGTVPEAPNSTALADPVLFNEAYYRSNHEDLAAMTDDQLREHWLSSGLKEGRCASPAFDVKWYLGNNSDLQAAFGAEGYEAAAKHFLDNGIAEGRQGSPRLNFSYYKSNYDDLVSAYGSNNYSYYLHYVTNGCGENRIGDKKLLKPMDGTYTIACRDSRSLMVETDDQSGARVQTDNDGSAQKFVLKKAGLGSYTLMNVKSFRYLENTGGDVLAQQSYSGGGAQRWYLIDNEDGSCGIMNEETRKYMDLSNNDQTAGTLVHAWEENGSDAQKWALSHRGSLKDGVYNLCASEDRSYCLAIAGSGMNNEANLALSAEAGGENQRFAVYRNSDGLYTLRALHSNLCVDVTNAVQTNGANVAQYTDNGTAAQRWAAVPNADGTYSFVSACNGLYLDIDGGTLAEGTNIQCYTGNGTAAQSWKPVRTASSSVTLSGMYQLVSANGGLALEGRGTAVTAVQASADMAQSFELHSLNDGCCSVVHTITGAYLSLSEEGVSLTDTAQPWQLIPNADGTVGLVNVDTGRYLALSGTAVTAGVYGTDAASRWNLVPVSHVHSYEDRITPPTCTQRGYTTHVCTSCGGSYVDTYVDALGHDYEVQTTEGTCTSLACNVYTCRVCGDSRREYPDAQWSEWSETAPEGMEEDMVQTRTLYRYADYETVNTRELVSGWDVINVRWVTDSTGSVEYADLPGGYDTSHTTYTTYHKDKVTASETETTKTVIDSDEVVGYIYWHWCYGQTLDTSYWRWIAPRIRTDLNISTFHAWVSQSAPTALGGEICTSSYEHYEGREFVSFENAIALSREHCSDTYLWFFSPIYRQTYTVQGKEYTCGRYGDWSDWSETPVEATDTRQVETRTEYRYITNSAPGQHSWANATEGEYYQAPTCTEDGFVYQVCTVCGAAGERRVLPAAGHSEVTDEAVAATCTAGGKTAGSHCSVCGEILVPQTAIPPKGHTEGLYSDNLDGTHAVFCSICGQIVRSEPHTYENGVCVCGVAAPVTEPVFDSNLKFRYSSFTMGSTLNMVYIVGAGTTNYADVRAVVTKHNADGTTTEKTYSISEGTMKDSGGFSTFTFDGIAAKELGDNFVARLYATGTDGTEYYGEEKTLNLKDFLLPYTQGTDPTKKDLAVALLNYGAAAQVYFNYNYDANDPSTLVNKDLTAEQKVIDIREATASVTVTGDGAKNVYNTVLLESKIVLYAIFNLSDYASRMGDLTAVVTNAETGEVVTTLPVTAMGTNGSFRFDDVSAKNTRTVFSVAIYDGETKVSQDLQWSIECMVSGCRADANSSQAKLNLANAILAYGDYAAAYLADA